MLRHLSHFKINDVTYSAAEPMPGGNWRFGPMYGGEEAWRNMARSVNAALPLLAKVEHEFDYGSPTELDLEHVVLLGELVQWVGPSQPWHGTKVVVLAQHHSLRACL